MQFHFTQAFLIIALNITLRYVVHMCQCFLTHDDEYDDEMLEDFVVFDTSNQPAHSPEVLSQIGVWNEIEAKS